MAKKRKLSSLQKTPEPKPGPQNPQNEEEEEEELEEEEYEEVEEEVEEEELEEVEELEEEVEEVVEVEELEEVEEIEEEVEEVVEVEELEEVEEIEEEEEQEEEEQEEDEENLLSRETLKKLLDPFEKPQLVTLVQEAITRNPTLLTRICESAKSDPVHRKLFVHGLPYDCTTETLTSAFKIYGEIEESKAVLDHITNRCKGYGFVLFKTRNGARNALRDPHKLIGGRSATCQLASRGSNANSDSAGRRVFVSNVGPNVNMDRLKMFFAKFGEIEEGPGKLQGLTTVFTYKTLEGCKKALEEPVKVFEGCALQCHKGVEGVKPNVAALTLPKPMAPVLQANDLAVAYAPKTGFANPTVAGLYAGQNGGGWVGLLNPAAGISPSANRSTAPSSSYGTVMGVNTVSPSVIGSYRSLAALHGLTGYQSGQVSPLGTEIGMRSKLGLGSSGSGLPHGFGR